MNRRALVGLGILVVSTVAMTALAQEATSSDLIDLLTSTTSTSTTIAADDSTTTSSSTESVVGEASTTEPVADVASLEIASSTAGIVEAASTSTVNIGSTTVEQISTLEESYFVKNGKYLQVMPGNKLPGYESGTVIGKLGKNIPAGARVDVYDGPKGLGYLITYEDAGTIYTIGFGPEAANFTSSRPVPVIVASSTEPVIEKKADVPAAPEATSTTEATSSEGTASSTDTVPADTATTTL